MIHKAEKARGRGKGGERGHPRWRSKGVEAGKEARLKLQLNFNDYDPNSRIGLRCRSKKERGGGGIDEGGPSIRYLATTEVKFKLARGLFELKGGSWTLSILGGRSFRNGEPMRRVRGGDTSA